MVGRVDDSASARGSSKQRGIAKQKIGTGCVLVFLQGNIITNQYSILAD